MTVLIFIAALEREALSAILARRREGAFISGLQMDERLSEMIAAKRRSFGVRPGCPENERGAGKRVE